MNNRGMSSIVAIFILIVGALAIIILMGVTLYGFNEIVGGLKQNDVMIGPVNLTEATDSTIGALNSSMFQYADIFSIVIVLGMFLGMIIAGFVFRSKHPKILFVIDILLMVFAYILAVYISNSYETVLTSIPFANIFIDNMPTGSALVLNLPLITLVAGAITIILSYSSIPKSEEEQVANF